MIRLQFLALLYAGSIILLIWSCVDAYFSWVLLQENPQLRFNAQRLAMMFCASITGCVYFGWRYRQQKRIWQEQRREVRERLAQIKNLNKKWN